MKPERPIVIVIILFIILLLIFFLAWPEYKNFKKLQADLGEKRAQYNAEKEYYAEITKRYYELQNRQEDLKKIDDALPQDPNFGKIIYYFHKTATDSGMIVKDLFLSNKSVASYVGDVQGVSAINDLGFSINVLGSYSSLGRFLVSLERSDRIFEVTSISFLSEGQAQLPSTPENPSKNQFQVQQVYTFSLQVKTHSY